MSSVESIALLCASTSHYAASIGASSGVGLSRLEFAGLLSGLPVEAMNFALAKYCGDSQALCLLADHVFMVYVGSLALSEQWAIDRASKTTFKMSRLAVAEMVGSSRCERCNGVGIVVNKTCKCCDGSGYARLSGRKIAEAIDVSEPQWRRVWRERYEKVIRYIQDIDYEVNNRVFRNSI